MRRLRLTNEHIEVFTPYFFWKKCDKCGYEIKKEKMWRIHILTRYNRDALYKNVCQHCLPTLNDATIYRENYLKKLMEPPPPPPPHFPPKKEKNIITDISVDENVERITFGSKIDFNDFESVVENGVYMLKRKEIK